jgi:prolyl 4-hydroxylase
VTPTLKLDYSPELADRIINTFQPILEQWSGISELESTGLSGIRSYQNGATIAEHVDLAESNVISCLINVDQDVEEPWPFEIRDHTGQMHPIHMKPGDAIIYESSR